jgi:methylglutaconyl-CoA hydratase
MSDPILLIDRSDPRVATLTLNRPDRRNALSVDLLTALRAAIDEVSSEAARRVLVLKGAGPAFCAGLDFHEAKDPSQSHRSAEALAGVYRALCGCRLVTIAVPHGGAFGGGAGLIAACDLAVASTDLQLGYPELRRGLVAALVTCLLRRQVAGRRLREMLLIGQTLSAQEALDAGLVNRVVPAPSLSAETMALAATVMDGAPGALARTKRLLDDLDGIDADLTTALEIHLKARNADEAQEGIAAFFERRPPRWAGQGDEA